MLDVPIFAKKRFDGVARLQGADLGSVVQRAVQARLQPTFGVTCRIVCDVLAALEHAYTRNAPGAAGAVVHRDVSPRNVFITFDGRVVLIDRPGQPKSECSYMSPEQALSSTRDARSDLFSVGIVLWELTVMRPLFSGPSEHATRARVLAAAITTPSARNPLIPPALDHIVLRALARDPALRYPSAAQMREALEALIAAEGWSASATEIERLMAQLFRNEARDAGAVPSQPLGADELATRRIKNPAALPDSPTVGGLPPGSSAEPTPAARRLRTVLLSAVVAILTFSTAGWIGARRQRRSPRSTLAPVVVQPTFARPAASGPVAPASAPRPAFVDVEAELQMELFVDGVPRQTSAGGRLAVEPAQRHKLGFRRPGHHHIDSVDVPAMAEGGVRRVVLSAR